jgi:hypothetical protein
MKYSARVFGKSFSRLLILCFSFLSPQLNCFDIRRRCFCAIPTVPAANAEIHSRRKLETGGEGHWVKKESDDLRRHSAQCGNFFGMGHSLLPFDQATAANKYPGALS